MEGLSPLLAVSTANPNPISKLQSQQIIQSPFTDFVFAFIIVKNLLFRFPNRSRVADFTRSSLFASSKYLFEILIHWVSIIGNNRLSVPKRKICSYSKEKLFRSFKLFIEINLFRSLSRGVLGTLSLHTFGAQGYSDEDTFWLTFLVVAEGFCPSLFGLNEIESPFVANYQIINKETTFPGLNKIFEHNYHLFQKLSPDTLKY